MITMITVIGENIPVDLNKQIRDAYILGASSQQEEIERLKEKVSELG